MKKLISLFLSLFCVFGAFAFPSGAATAASKSLMIYTSLNLTFKKPENDKYNISISNNKDGYIKVDANNEGEYYWLMVHGKKETVSKSKPVIKITKKSGKKTVVIKQFTFAVKPAVKVEMKDQKLNKDTSIRLKLKNPYDNEYKFTFSTKGIASIAQYLYSGDDAYYTLKGLKKGTTTVKAYIYGTKTLIGSFKVTVGNYSAKIKQSYQSLNLVYNEHIKSSENLPGGKVDLSKAVSLFHAEGKISAKISNSSVAGVKSVAKTDVTPAGVLLIAKGKGKATITLYETVGKTKTKIGTIKLTVKRAKDSKVYDGNRELDNDGIFYENFISPGQTYNLKKAVVDNYLNNKWTKSHFDAKEYTFTAKSSNPDIISVNTKGVLTCHKIDKKGTCKITYTIVFADGSKSTGSGHIETVEMEDY